MKDSIHLRYGGPWDGWLWEDQADPLPIPATTPSPMVTDSVGTSGASAMQVPAARAAYDVTGAGIKIGIISDSFDAQGPTVLAQEEADGDLPSSVTILSDDRSGTDEGRAIAEVIHAAAPGAQIYFAAAGNTQADFAASVASLEAAGVNIIVDDITYYDEPFFQLGSATQVAVGDAVASGIDYFTAASNEGGAYYQTTIALTASTVSLPFINGSGSRFPGHGSTSQVYAVDFGSTAAVSSYDNEDYLQAVSVAAGTTVDIDLQWTQPFQSISGTGSAYSLSLYVYNSTLTRLVASATGNVTGSDPVQTLEVDNAGNSTATYELAIVWSSGSNPTGDTLKYILYGSYTASGEVATIEDSAAGTGSGTVTGHELVSTANTVGATNSANPTTPESFSSYGPGIIYDSVSGTVLSTPLEAAKVNFVAPDDIATSVSGFSAFYGTSAAAPDAAAVAALMLQANPNLDTGEVTTLLEETASAISGNTLQTGAGLVNADAAVAAAIGSQWVAAAGGVWSNAADWSGGALPTSAAPVTLNSDDAALTAAYTVSVTIADATAQTLTLGNGTSIEVSLMVAGGLAVAGGMTVGADGKLVVAGTLSVGGALAGDAVTLDPGGMLALTTTSTTVLTDDISATILRAGGVVSIDLRGVSYGDNTLRYSNGTLEVSSGSIALASLRIGGGSDLTFTQAADGAGGDVLSVACFAAGTRLATARGEVAVEGLRVGDHMVLAAGGTAPITWLGHRRVACRRHPRPHDVQPICVRRGAFGPSLPRRDLRLSPDHAVARDGVLIPIRALVNGATIVQLDVDALTYWHVELPAHDIILAEGLASESYLDTGNRGAFVEGAAPGDGGGAAPGELHPDFARRIWSERGCAELVLAGPRLAAARRSVLARAEALGHCLTPAPQLAVLADGRVLPASIANDTWHVAVPATVRRIRLVSRSWVPCETRPDGQDARKLGVAISRLWLDGREVSLESPGLCDGWHAPEPAWRWTDGDAGLAIAGVRMLSFTVALTGSYWVKPLRRRRAA
jgi:hypothetical protein